MTTLPSVSIGIATYSRRDVVANTIGEILRRETMPKSIIVVEQDAPYDTTALIEQCRSRGVECVYVFSRYRSTPCARNYAVSLCTSDVIVFIDDDVELLTDIVRAHAEIHAQEPDAIAAGGLLTCYPKTVAHVKANSFFPTTRYLTSVKGGNMSFKVAELKKARGFNDFIAMHTEENDLIRRLIRLHGARIATCQDAIVLHLAHGSGGTRNLQGESGADGGSNAACSHTWWRLYTRDHVVSYGCNYGVVTCVAWFLARYPVWRRVVQSAPSTWQGLRALFADFIDGLRLRWHAVRIEDHVAYSRVLSTNSVGITCPADYLTQWRLLPRTANSAP